ncbi:hypothetical protein [Kribbella sp. NPDC006257]|uniref:hypothetical protein n=1 Tax=Kribbella sp. NPDC006257 TaxID=3156738 RepID=UPI0033AFEE09
MNNHGENTQPAHADPGLAAAALVVFAHRHEVVHLLYSAADQEDAVRRIADLLQISESAVTDVLTQPLGWMLPQSRADLEVASTRPSAPELASTGPLAPELASTRPSEPELASTGPSAPELAADGRSTA